MEGTAHIFKALADPTRRQILQELKDGELSAGEIGSRFDMTAPSISRHLSILKNAELIGERKEGNRIFYCLEPDRLAFCLNDFLSQVCPTQISHRRKRGQAGEES
jgi:DNA-binding transcriptional ArsR family regulator